MKKIAIFAALDTKGAEAQFIAEIVRLRGHKVIMIDVGVLGQPQVTADISATDVAKAGGVDLMELRRSNSKAMAMAAMTRGAAELSRTLYRTLGFDAIVAIGGTAGAAIGSSAMRELPLGIPKVLLSTVAAGDTRPYIGTKDITMMYSVVDIAGLNRISKRVLANAAGAVVGMVETEIAEHKNRPLIAASMFGNTTACVERARGVLESAGYEVLVFHATGVGGMTMESLIADGYIDGVFDITTTELADELCGGVFSAGKDRLRAAAIAGIPQVVAPGCLDMVNFGAPETVPEKYRGRKLYHWNANVTLMRTNVEENERLGRLLAKWLNQSTGPLKVLLPLRGLSQLDSEGGEFWDPDANCALFRSLRKHLRTDIPVTEINSSINDPNFADQAANILIDLIQEKRNRLV